MTPDQDPQPTPPPPDHELRDLLSKLVQGELSPAEAEVLGARLRADPAARAAYVDAMQLESLLHLEFPSKAKGVAREVEEGAKVLAFSPPARRGMGEVLWRWGSLAAVIVAIVSAWWFFGSPRSGEVTAGKAGTASTAGTPAAVRAIATLVDARGCRWVGPRIPAIEERLDSGILELAEGVALIEFDGGARIVLQGPAALELRSARSAQLRHGSATVRCDGMVYGFSLLTPQSTVVDLGTEFGVVVGKDGSTAVEVLDGAVEVAARTDDPQPTTRFLTAGERLAMDATGADQLAKEPAGNWIRDYTSRAERSVVSQPARVIAHDSFLLRGVAPTEYQGGTGWVGPWWVATKERRNDFRVVPATPIKKRAADDTQGIAINAGVEIRRRLAEAIDPRIAQRVYVGFSIFRSFEKLKDERGRLGEVTVLLRSAADPATFVGMGLSPLNFWVTADPGGWERSDSPAMGAGPFFVVARLDFLPGRGNQVAMTAFDAVTSVPEQEPETWLLTTRRQMTDLEEVLDVVALRARHIGAFKFGEIQVGNTWQSVIHPAALK